MSASIFPAPAGMSRCSDVVPKAWFYFPRTCGDEPRMEAETGIATEFSPHLRG